ncbi:MAG: sortase [Candidatus Marinimicrobia bacterium]|nr:sortase [Candidatus Neomarinimicrobiota bacterium]
MKTEYVIHQEGENFVVYDARLEKSKNRKIKTIGVSFLLGALFGFLILISPFFLAEIQYRLHKVSQSPKIVSSRFGQLLWLDKKGILSPKDWQFSLIIPEINLNTKVEESVDISNQKEFQLALKSGVAHAQGTALPGESGTIYLFGHSTDYPWNIGAYSAFFYPLRYLQEGEEVVIIYHGKNYLFKVKETQVVEANKLEYLETNNGEERLVLQTCWPPGTSWKRLIVVADPVKEI